ncbi:hypothetical protein E2C01_092355 [Portunus trituberculatus]|uniref:THAP-type domain-containing protein n=1 Tax=Portunus trituberculatus TaxID=210409 RepID=A0A5B7JRT6_PORTR|nr:hypothetical protein [Portunus trituberculatus]
MGSSCLIKTCPVKKTRLGASFHRLPWKHPSLRATLQGIFGAANVREVTRWSRICSLHIAQLAPHAATHKAVRRLMEYYMWNARSYKRIFELSSRFEGEAGTAVKDVNCGGIGNVILHVLSDALPTHSYTHEHDQHAHTPSGCPTAAQLEGTHTHTHTHTVSYIFLFLLSYSSLNIRFLFIVVVLVTTTTTITSSPSSSLSSSISFSWFSSSSSSSFSASSSFQQSKWFPENPA